MSKAKVIVPAVFVLILAVAAASLLTSAGKAGLKEGDKIPPVTIPLYDGSTVAIPGGRPAVVHFWASWCEECRKEAPVWKRVDEGILIVWVSYRDAESKALEFLREWGISYPAGKDPGGRLARLFGVTGVPETYLIKADGTLLRRYIGPLGEEELRRILRELLEK